MTAEQKIQIDALRKSGEGYKSISIRLNLSVNTVKSYCQRHHVESPKLPKNIRLCLQCGKEVLQTPHRKAKKFCCDKCRMNWWKAHSAIIDKKSQQIFICPVCGESLQQFQAEILFPNLLRKIERSIFMSNIFQYQTVMAWVRFLLDDGIISKSEYAKIDTMMTKKYNISSCSIFR